MARKMRDSWIFADRGRRDTDIHDDEQRSWLDHLKEAFGFESKPHRLPKQMHMRDRFSLGYFVVALLLMILIQNLFLAETIHRIAYSEFKDFVRTGKVESVTLNQDEVRGQLKDGQEAALGSTRLF